MNSDALPPVLKDHYRDNPRTFTSARAMPLPRQIPLRAEVEFTKFGVTRAGRVIGISHDDPMRYDLKLEDGAIIPNIPEPDISAIPSGSSRAPLIGRHRD
ncbi:MAG TPA: hypothetical protein VKU84_18840 [Stellaceae bacterium]|nr:hypothetical protein [Stellaceae bacterium]